MKDKDDNNIWNLYFESKNQEILEESVHIFVPDSPKKPITTLGKVDFNVQEKLYQFLFKNLNLEEKKKLNDFGSNIFATDGFDFDKSKGVLNFYIAGIPEDYIEKCISLIKYYLGEFNAKIVGEIRRDQSKMFKSEVIRFPVEIVPPSEKVESAPELNWSNMNARIIFDDLLGYESSIIDGGYLDARDVLMKISQVEDNDFLIGKNSREAEQRGNIHIVGLNSDEIKQRLEVLKQLCDWAIDHNYSTIGLS